MAGQRENNLYAVGLALLASSIDMGQAQEPQQSVYEQVYWGRHTCAVPPCPCCRVDAPLDNDLDEQYAQLLAVAQGLTVREARAFVLMYA